LVRIVFDAELRGSEYRCVGDFSIVKKDTFQTGTISIYSPYINDESGFNLTANETYDLPEEEYDFPVYPDDEWCQSFTKFTNYTGNIGSDLVDECSIDTLHKRNMCNGTAIKEVADSHFHTFVIEMGEGTETRFFAEDARNTVYAEVNSGTFIDITNVTININGGHIELTDYDVNDYDKILQVSMLLTPISSIRISGFRRVIFRKLLSQTYSAESVLSGCDSANIVKLRTSTSCRTSHH